MLQSFFHVALIATGLFLLLSLAAGVSCVRCYRRRRPMAGTWRLLLTGLFGALTLSSAFLAAGVVGYQRLTFETEIAQLSVRQVEPNRYYVQLRDATGLTRGYALDGQQWQLEARVITWRGPARLAGFAPLYRLERISGRWGTATQQRESPSSAHDLPEPFIDLWSAKRRLPEVLRFVQADYGSGAYLPLIDGARYRVTLSQGGGLVAYPADEETAEMLRRMGW
ncbi:MAG TPA: hypothetical protein PKZ76_03900 [Xanthomonadaceae bacterium]|nr:hypothetical protein [Xanthomonadaceae bacterium]